MATFNFDRFDQEYETRELVQNLVSVIQEARRPDDANQRLIPADEGTPLHGLLARLRVGQEPVLEQFDFELGEILTIEAATNLCIAGGANPPEMFSTIANRVLFNAALDRQAPRWVHVSSFSSFPELCLQLLYLLPVRQLFSLCLLLHSILFRLQK